MLNPNLLNVSATPLGISNDHYTWCFAFLLKDTQVLFSLKDAAIRYAATRFALVLTQKKYCKFTNGWHWFIVNSSIKVSWLKKILKDAIKYFYCNKKNELRSIRKYFLDMKKFCFFKLISFEQYLKKIFFYYTYIYFFYLYII